MSVEGMNDQTFGYWENRVKEFCVERDWDQFHSPKDLAIAISIEATEVLECFRFMSDDEVAEKLGNPNFRESVGDELADTLFLIFRLSEMYGFNLPEALERKIQKSAKRYPVELAKGSNVKYDRRADHARDD